jgi:hypothetical protein
VLTTPERKTHTSHEKKVHLPQKKSKLTQRGRRGLAHLLGGQGQRENVEGSLFIVW